MAKEHLLTTFYVNDLHLGVEVECVQEVLANQDLTGVPLAPPVVGGAFLQGGGRWIDDGG